MSDPAAPYAGHPEPLSPAQFEAAYPVSRETLARLEAFVSLLAEWNSSRFNLVSANSLADVWRRHVWDSAQLAPLIPQSARSLADLGSGAGFPGLVLAILAKNQDGACIHLVESMTKRCRFLQAVIDALDLPAVVHNVRAESLTLKVDVVTARACAPMVKLLGYAWPYLRAGATGLFLKGQDVEVELQDAATSWKFQADLIPSISHVDGRIARLKKVSRVRPV